MPVRVWGCAAAFRSAIAERVFKSELGCLMQCFESIDRLFMLPNEMMKSGSEFDA